MENVWLFIDYAIVFKNILTYKVLVWESDIDF